MEINRKKVIEDLLKRAENYRKQLHTKEKSIYSNNNGKTMNFKELEALDRAFSEIFRKYK